MPFGYTPEGFVIKPIETIIEELETAQLAIDSSMTFGSEEPSTQLNATFAEQLEQAWEAIAAASNFDPTSAEDFRADQVAAITGTSRDAATASTALIDCVFTSGGVTLSDGVAKIRHEDLPSIEFVADGDYTSTGAGTESVPFRATVTGPVQAATAKLTQIVTPVAGWTGASNPEDATPGRETETDSELKEKRELELAAGGGASFPTLRSALSRTTGVTSVNLLNNRTLVTDANGVPAKSLEAIVSGGTDQDVANTLFVKAGGVASFAGSTAVAVTDAAGKSHEVRFTRPSDLNMWLVFTLSVDPNRYGETAFKTAISATDATLEAGDDVLLARLSCSALNQPGVLNVISVLVGISDGGEVAADYVIDPRQIADYDSARIDVILV